MESIFAKGDLVRWITGHSVYEATEDMLVGADPIYQYGIIVEVSNIDPEAIIVNACLKSRTPRLVILNASEEDIEILSNGSKEDGQ